jgi:NADH-ubiquinone oxidoreductase chain 5
MYLTILCMPLCNLLCNGLLGRKVGIKGTYSLSIITSIITLLTGLWAFYEVTLCKSPVNITLGPWVNIEFLQIDWELIFDSLTVSMFLAVNIVSCLVQIYSIEYMKDDPHVQRFFAYLSLFTLLMLILVTGNNYFVMFLGWEGILLCLIWFTSFFLITKI